LSVWLSLRLLTHFSHDTVHLFGYWRDFNETWHKYSPHLWVLLKRFSKSEVKGQGHSEAVACIFENGRSYELCVNFCQRNTYFMVSWSCGQGYQVWRLDTKCAI